MKFGRRVLSGAAWNMAGQVAPLLVALACIPLLIADIGLDRFGFIALAWVLVGYASLLDLGIGRALVRTVSARLAAGDRAGAAESASAGLSLLFAFGLVLAAGMAIAAPWLAERVLHVPQDLGAEARVALVWLACSLPFVMLNGGYNGVLTAHQAFKPLNLVRAVLGSLSYLVPVVLTAWGHVALPVLIASILVLRALGSLVMAAVCWRHCAWHWRVQRARREIAQELLGLGGWMSVSNLVGPLLTSMDRLLIGALVPLRSVGLYAVPYDLLSRLMVIPYSIVMAVFPSVTTVTPGLQAQEALGVICRWLHIGMLPLLFLIMAWAYPAMSLWLGAAEGAETALVLQVLVPGVYLNTLAQGPATLIQAAGRPRDMALLHLAELPCFLVLLWALTASLGIVGTALAATLRFAVDGWAVSWLARRGMQLPGWPWRAMLETGALAIVLFGAALLCRTWASALGVSLLGLVLYAVHTWTRVLVAPDRQRLLEVCRHFSRR